MFGGIFDFMEDLVEDVADAMFGDDTLDGQDDLEVLPQNQTDDAFDTDLNGDAYLVDLDGDGIYDALAQDILLDTDGDGFLDTVLTEMQIDTDGDGIADSYASVQYTDSDGDGIFDTVIESIDYDGDGIADYSLFTMEEDTDGDGIADVVHIGEDFDGDGVLDTLDSFADYDGDGIWDPADGSAMDCDAPAYVNFDPNNSDDDGVIGDPAEAMDSWHWQETNSSCAVASQEFVLETLTGHEFSEAELRDLAEENGWYDPDGGTPMDDVGNILEHMGLTVHKSTGNDISDLEECLSNGGEVIVGVDSSELWEGESDDFFGPGMGADHAIQVIGIDRSNPGEPMVIINDSGCTNGCGAMVPLDVFMDAWEDSGCFMVEAYA